MAQTNGVREAGLPQSIDQWCEAGGGAAPALMPLSLFPLQVVAAPQ